MIHSNHMTILQNRPKALTYLTAGALKRVSYNPYPDTTALNCGSEMIAASPSKRFILDLWAWQWPI